MIFTETKLKGAFVIELEMIEDERGSFARAWCAKELAARGLEARLAQCSTSLTKKKGTLRGMHFQIAPFEESKIVRCTRGSMYDVIIDLRTGSPTLKQHIGVTLAANNGKMLYVPRGFAHGYLTLEDNIEVFYQISEFYSPNHSRGVRWNDPAFGIAWPADVQVIAKRDQSYPDFIPVAESK